LLITGYFIDFLEKVKTGKAQSFTGAGFGGKGLDRLDKERDAKEKAERSAYGEAAEEKAVINDDDDDAAVVAKPKETKEADPFADFKVEIRRGPAPDSSKGGVLTASSAAVVARLAKAKEEEKAAMASLEAAKKAGKDSAALRQAQSVVAKLNAQVKATKLVMQSQAQLDEVAGRKPKDPDATDFHAIVPINDYPQKARWRVTNKETMVQVRPYFFFFKYAWPLSMTGCDLMAILILQLIDMTGASVTNKGERIQFDICHL
jgi:ATP-dependent RNA helicase DDX46/PRP5